MCTESVNITSFRSFCTSLYRPTCELWWQYRSESLRKLCVAYNMFLDFYAVSRGIDPIHSVKA